MNEVHKDIVSQALDIYLKFGIKSITMDDMASRLGMSKKTLYKYVNDKDDLVRQALEYQASVEETDIEAICMLGYNAIEESWTISQYISKILKNISPSVHYDLEKYHKQTFSTIIKQRHIQIFDCLQNNFKKGIAEGFYRKELDIEIVIKLYLTKIPAIFDGELFPPERFTFVKVNEEFFNYHIRGIATPKGLDYLEQKIINKT